MAGDEHPVSPSRRYLPSMTKDYSRISDTAKAIDLFVLPKILSYLESIKPILAAMPTKTPFVIADYGSADGVNSSQLFEGITRYIHGVNPSLKIRLVYIDIADPALFYEFWEGSNLSKLNHVESEYIMRSFYEPFPELTGRINIGFSSTSLHWLDTKNVDTNFFRHPECIQANQLPESGRDKFVEKWKCDWRVFLHERSRDLVDGGILFLANLTSLGPDQWPASAGYNNLRDICNALYREGRISKTEMTAIFIPDYFATPEEMKNLVEEENIKQHFTLKFLDTLCVPCAYFTRMHDGLENTQNRHKLAHTLTRVVRAWSESSVKVGLSLKNKDLIDEIYNRLTDIFFKNPEGLPYQYCLIELIKSKHPE